MSDLRKRPWKTLRVVVEVKVPPTNSSTEKDLRYLLQERLPESLALPRFEHPRADYGKLRFKLWSRFFPMARLKFRKGEKI